MYIINIGEQWLEKGMFPSNSSILIQITSPLSKHIKPPKLDNFSKIYRFKFDDINDYHLSVIEKLKKENQNLPCFSIISNLQAKNIAKALIYAKTNNLNVVVNCEAGISRSGAIAQVAIDLLGFEDLPDISCLRKPNNIVYKLVKSYIEEVL